MNFFGIDRCDNCGQLLEDGQWLVGLCKTCERIQKVPKKRRETVKPSKRLL